MKNMLSLLFVCFVFYYTNAQNWNQIIKTASVDRGDGEQFGFSVALSGDYAIVSAYRDDEDASGVNAKTDAGSVFIFKRNGNTWTFQQKLVASDRAADDFFGYSVDIDGDYAVVGAFQEDEDASGANTLSNAGAVYVFKNINGTWTQQQKLVAADRAVDDNFGFSSGISGEYIVVGSYREDEDANGNNTLSGAGSCYIFKINAGNWTEYQKIVASGRSIGDNFGWTLAIDKDQIIAGANSDREDSNESNPLTAAGSAIIFKDSLGIWVQKQKIVNSDRASFDRFGHSVSIEGDYAFVGANLEDEDAAGGNTLSGAGSVYVFKNNSGTWSQVQKVVASDRSVLDNFGNSVSVSGDYFVVGAHREDEDVSGNNSMPDAGSIYIFKNNAGIWTQTQKIVTTDRAAADFFGFDVAMSNYNLLAGSHLDDEDALGNNFLNNAGSAYFFGLTLPEITLMGNSVSISDGDHSPAPGDHTDFGSVLVCNGSIEKIFVIKNSGWDTLHIDSIKLNGAHAGDFIISNYPGAFILSGAIDTLTVSFDPSASGNRNAIVYIYNDDENEAEYDYAIKGEGLTDNIPPVVTCPSNKSFTTLPGQCTVTGISLGTATATDNCGLFGGVINNAPSSYNLGITNVSWSATDINGNTGSCIQKITVLPYSCGVPVQVYHLDTTNNSAKIKWKAGKCASVYELRIRQQISPGVWTSWSSWSIASGPGLLHQFNGLIAGKFYNYQLRSLCGISYSASINGWFNTLSAFDKVNNRNEDDHQTTINGNSIRPGLILMPNPATQFTNLRIHGFEDHSKKIVLFDPFGKSIFQYNLDANINELELDLYELNLHSGIYFIQILNGAKRITRSLWVE